MRLVPGCRLSAHAAWEWEAHYLAVAISNVFYTLSPQRIILGGGVMRQDALFPMIRRNVMQIVNGYIDRLQVGESIDSYIVSPRLGRHSGVLGAILLAGRTYSASADWK